MRYVEYGNGQGGKVKVSEIIGGLMRISNLSVSELEVLIEAYLEEGINAFDLADVYAEGKCDELLGELLKVRPDLRDKMWIQDKTGIIHGDKTTYFDFSKEHLLEAVNTSLKRLNTDHLDSLLLHRPDILMEMDEVADAFDTLQREGKVLSFGVSNVNRGQIELLEKYLNQKIEANQLQMSCAFAPGIDEALYVNTHFEEGISYSSGTFEYCRLKDIAIQAWSSLQYGWFEGVFFNMPKFEKMNAEIDLVAKEHGVTNTAVALAWILRYPGRTQAIIGTTKPQRVHDSARAADFELTRKEYYEIYAAGGHLLL